MRLKVWYVNSFSYFNLHYKQMKIPMLDRAIVGKVFWFELTMLDLGINLKAELNRLLGFYQNITSKGQVHGTFQP